MVMTMGNPKDTDLPVAWESIDDPEKMLEHLKDINKVLSGITDETRAGNLAYEQSHVLERASELLLEEYKQAEEYGEHEAELLAYSLVLSRSEEKEVH